MFAAWKADVACGLVHLLCTAGADTQLTDDDGETALMKVAATHGPICIQKLFDWGCHVNVQDNIGQTALHHCLLNDSSHQCYDGPACVSLLLQLGADPNIQDATGLNALHSAILSSWPLETLTMLADKVTDINVPDNNGATALLYAVEEMDDASAVAQMLLAHKADVNVRCVACSSHCDNCFAPRLSSTTCATDVVVGNSGPFACLQNFVLVLQAAHNA